MPIHLGPNRFEQNADEELAGDGQALFELLASQVRRMSPRDQIAVVTALTSEGWSTLTPEQRRKFDEVAAAYLEEGPPE